MRVGGWRHDLVCTRQIVFFTSAINISQLSRSSANRNDKNKFKNKTVSKINPSDTVLLCSELMFFFSLSLYYSEIIENMLFRSSCCKARQALQNGGKSGGK